jgi:hypothetical protein
MRQQAPCEVFDRNLAASCGLFVRRSHVTVTLTFSWGRPINFGFNIDSSEKILSH